MSQHVSSRYWFRYTPDGVGWCEFDMGLLAGPFEGPLPRKGDTILLSERPDSEPRSWNRWRVVGVCLCIYEGSGPGHRYTNWYVDIVLESTLDRHDYV